MLPFGPATRAWFQRQFEAPTRVQSEGWPRIAAGEHTLLIAPTGSGKTLAAFLFCIDRLVHGATRGPGVRTLYVSPLKALVYDIERNLRAPLAGIADEAARRGDAIRIPRVAIRTGDTSPADRRLQLRDPAEILVTTPESLYLLLGSQAAETLRTVDTIIIDEVHALAPGKRGSHLALSLERLVHLVGDRDPQRIGLSATARPLDAVARFIGGDRPVSIVDAHTPPRMDLKIVVPVPDMTRPAEGRPADAPVPEGESLEHSLWPAVYPRLLDLIAEHATTIVFVNSRGLCERLAQRLNEIAGEEIVLSHHGSISHAQRAQVEERLKQGQIRAIVATSSLELGIDMGSVDLVVLVESPGAVHRGLQRVGRAGHGVGQQSRGRVFPKHRGDLLEATVVARRMREGEIEALRVPKNQLDVLAQHVVAMCGQRDWSVGEIEAVIRRAYSFADLPRDAFIGTLDMLAGKYPSHAFADLRPRLDWDREADTLQARRGAKMIAIASGGTIPDRGTYTMILGEGGPRVGELDEEMVHETLPGQNIMLGASTWRVERITRDRVIVSPAPGETGRLPFWRGDGPGRPVELGRAMGQLVDEIGARQGNDAEAWLRDAWDLDAFAAKNLVAYVHEQRNATGVLPTDRAITIERFRDEVGDHRICILSSLGSRVHAPWALAIQGKLEATFGFQVQALWSDDGIVLRLVDVETLPGLEALLPGPDEIEELVVAQLAHSALFAGQFRENAARALLLPRRRAHERQPLWAQRLRAQQLLAVARQYPSFPIILETYRACLEDVFDLPALRQLLAAVARREVHVDIVDTPSPSPFARSLVFQYVAAYLYEGDAPLAERKAQALALDRKLLRELLGEDALRDLLDREVVEAIEDELQGRRADRRATDPEALRDRLRRVGDLSADEAAQRSDGDSRAWLEVLRRERKIFMMTLGGTPRYVAAEDVATYRDGTGAAMPEGVPAALSEPVTDPLLQLVARWAHTHGPFVGSTLAERWGVTRARIDEVLARLCIEERVVPGPFGIGDDERQWCDADVLRRIKQRTLTRLRAEIAPVPASALGRFLPGWHGIGDGRRGTARLLEAIAQLEGHAISYAELERAILPARVADFAPRMLDELGASGQLVWVGRGALGKNDGRVALIRRDRAALLVDPPQAPADLALGDLHRSILDHLARRGACFFVELQTACGDAARVGEVRDALWELAWAGLVTNDTFSALRAFARPIKERVGRANASLGGGGRWSLVADLVAARPDVTATERAHARASTLLERHGIVTRETAVLEDLPGGFSAIYPVLAAMEESGRVRRGYFVDGLGGAQFASPGAVDRIRTARRGSTRDAVVLSAVDPANPYGWLLPWPVREAAATPRRIPGAVVVLVEGEAVLFVDRGGRRLVTFAPADEPAVMVMAAKALRAVAAGRRGKMLRIETVDGTPARTSAHAPSLRAADFESDVRGLTLSA